MPPKVSIVVPAFNAAEYIAETMDSLLAQDYPDLEIVAVDDGSTDATGVILARYEGRIKLHRQANAGQSAAMATGWKYDQWGLYRLSKCGRSVEARRRAALC